MYHKTSPSFSEKRYEENKTRSVTIQLNSFKTQKNGELGTVPMIHNIFEFALERNHINKSKLLRYASRRNRREKVEQILHEIDCVL